MPIHLVKQKVNSIIINLEGNQDAGDIKYPSGSWYSGSDSLLEDITESHEFGSAKKSPATKTEFSG
jgi:hypothetical protein